MGHYLVGCPANPLRPLRNLCGLCVKKRESQTFSHWLRRCWSFSPTTFFLATFTLLPQCTFRQEVRSGSSQYDLIIRGGDIYNGTGSAPFIGDVGINSDTIAFIGDLSHAHSSKEINAKGLAVSPGFINMLSWADGSLVKDGRSMSDIKQGVTLEVFGEGWSPGPKKDSTKNAPWRSFAEYFQYLERKGVSTNVASFVGATTVRMNVLQQEKRAPTPTELDDMRQIVRTAMEQGAMGVGSSLIYAPADYASTSELTELSKVAASFGGMYISHMRSESDHIYSGLKEFFTITRDAHIRGEIYHLKINHPWNWNKIDTVLRKIDSARKSGLNITANMYTYTASGTGLIARLPTWVQEGGGVEMRKRLRNKTTRRRVLDDLAKGIPSRNSDPADVMIMGFRLDSLNRLYKGKRLDEVARLHGKNADETMIDLIVRDKSTVPSIFFLINEDNVKRMLKLPFVSLCSDAASVPAESPYTEGGAHPRTYGSFARFLGKYVRDEKLMPMEEGIRRMTSLPAENLRIRKRGTLGVGNFADVAIFNATNFKDMATFEKPHQYAVGMKYVLVNGMIVIANGEHTGAMPGRFVKGPGYRK